MTDFPYGDGFKDCPFCFGRGALDVEGLRIPATKPCPCVEDRDRLDNMQKRWKGLALKMPVPSSPLQGREGGNLRITATQETLRAHFHRVCMDHTPGWHFAVESDRELAKAWLYTAKINDEAYDPDVALDAPKYRSLEDLSDNFDLLILFVGIKAARNSASPELLVDVVQGRDFLDRVTWVVDDPNFPLVPGHISYSENAAAMFEGWDHITLGDPSQGDVPAPPRKRSPTVAVVLEGSRADPFGGSGQGVPSALQAQMDKDKAHQKTAYKGRKR